jgi:hypothetical protein
MGILRRTLQKCLLKIFRKNWILGRKTRFSRKSNRIFVKFPGLNRKNRIPPKIFFHDFRGFSAKLRFSQNIYFYDPIRENRIPPKTFFTIFAICENRILRKKFYTIFVIFGVFA